VALKASTWVGILAGLFVVAGLSLLIAHNWEDIGPSIRIICFLLLLGLVGEARIRTAKRNRALHIPLEVAWFLFPLLGIGLYAQTFQLSGHPIRPFLIWLTLTLPMVWASPYRYLAWIHMVSLLTVLFIGNLGHGDLNLYSSTGGEWAGIHPWAWLFTAMVWGVLWVENRTRVPLRHQNLLWGAGLAWIYMVLAAPTPFQIEHPGWLIILAFSLATIWMLGPLFLRTSERHSLGGGIAWLGLVYGLTFLWHADGHLKDDFSLFGIVITAFVLLAAIVTILRVRLERVQLDGRWSLLARGLFFFGLLLPVLTLTQNVSVIQAVGLTSNVFLAGIAVALMWYGATVGKVGEVNGGIALFLLLLITRFVDVLGDMFQSGLGMIAAGILLALVAFGLEKGRRKLLNLTREHTP